MDIVLRVAVIYLFILIALRLMGKREFGQLSPMELVTLLIIPEIVSQALTDQDRSVTGALIGVVTLLLLVFGTSLLVHLSKKAGNIIDGVPTVLIHNGQFLEKNMNQERVSPEEILSEMHKSGVEQLQQVRWAILEPDGKIAIIQQQDESKDRSAEKKPI